MNHNGIDEETPRRKGGTLVYFERRKGRLSAEPARRRHHESALRLRRLDHHFGRKLHHYDVWLRVRYPANLTPAADDALGEEKSGRQLKIVARRAHGHRKAPRTYSNLERLFDGKQVFLPLRYQAVDLADWNTDGAWRHKPFPNPSRRSSATARA